LSPTAHRGGTLWPSARIVPEHSSPGYGGAPGGGRGAGACRRG
jgi:hypothetical protein